MTPAKLAKLELPTLLKLRNNIDARLASLRETISEQLASLGLGTSTKRGRKPKAARRAHALKGTKRPAKYRDPATGNTWAGVGMTPRWLTAYEAEGKSRDHFATGANMKAKATKPGRKRRRSKKAARK